MEKSLEELNGKIRTLKFRMGKTENVILTRDKEALDRQLISVSTISTIVNTLKETIEENMFLQNKTEEQVKDWASEPELMLAQADQCLRRINSELKSVETAANEAITQKEEERKLEFERRLTEQKLQQEKQATEEKRKLDFEHLKTMQEVETLRRYISFMKHFCLTWNPCKPLDKLDAAVRFIFDKLVVIKSELAMTNEKWDEWTFVEFVKALERWTKNNPNRETSSSKYPKEKGRTFFAKSHGNNNDKGCLFCSNEGHKAVRCDKVTNPGDRKKIFAEKQLCFNCAGGQHRAADCKSKNICQTCQGKHHTPICDKSRPPSAPREPGMTANHIGASTVVHPVVVVRINGYKFRALLDSGASHSYASASARRLACGKS